MCTRRGPPSRKAQLPSFGEWSADARPCEVTAPPGGWPKRRVKTQTLPVKGRTRPRAGLTLQPPRPIQQVLVPKAPRAPELSLASQDPTWRPHLAAQHVFISYLLCAGCRFRDWGCSRNKAERESAHTFAPSGRFSRSLSLSETRKAEWSERVRPRPSQESASAKGFPERGRASPGCRARFELAGPSPLSQPGPGSRPSTDSPREWPELPWLEAAKRMTASLPGLPTPANCCLDSAPGPRAGVPGPHSLGRVSQQRGLQVWPRGACTLAFCSPQGRPPL